MHAIQKQPLSDHTPAFELKSLRKLKRTQEKRIAACENQIRTLNIRLKPKMGELNRLKITHTQYEKSLQKTIHKIFNICKAKNKHL